MLVMKRRNNKLLAIVLVVFVLASGYGIYLLMSGRDMTVAEILRPRPGARLLMSMEGFRSAKSEGGKVVWSMRAATADLYDNREARLRDIEIVYAASDRGRVSLISDTGSMDTESGDAVLKSESREVRVVTGDGYLLTTGSISWHTASREVRTSDTFKLLGREIYLEGKGVTANVDDQTVVVKENVKAVLQE